MLKKVLVLYSKHSQVIEFGCIYGSSNYIVLKSLSTEHLLCKCNFLTDIHLNYISSSNNDNHVYLLCKSFLSVFYISSKLQVCCLLVAQRVLCLCVEFRLLIYILCRHGFSTFYTSCLYAGHSYSNAHAISFFRFLYITLYITFVFSGQHLRTFLILYYSLS